MLRLSPEQIGSSQCTSITMPSGSRYALERIVIDEAHEAVLSDGYRGRMSRL